MAENDYDFPRLAERVDAIEVCLNGKFEKRGCLTTQADHGRRIDNVEKAMTGAVRALWGLIVIGGVGVVSFIWSVITGSILISVH